MRTPLVVLCTLVLAAVLVVGMRQARHSTGAASKPLTPLSLAAISKPIARAPADLAALRRRVNVLAGGGAKAFEAQLRALRGHPVVVNMWASSCDPCRYELPMFQREAIKRGAQVAFLGVNVLDPPDAAHQMAARIPMPYPSFADPRGNIAVGIYRTHVLPVTAFYDARGKLSIIEQGQFASEAKLSAAIERYALQ